MAVPTTSGQSAVAPGLATGLGYPQQAATPGGAFALPNANAAFGQPDGTFPQTPAPENPPDPNAPPVDPNAPQDPNDPNNPQDPNDPNNPEDPNAPKDPNDPNAPEDPNAPKDPNDPNADPNAPQDPNNPSNDPEYNPNAGGTAQEQEYSRENNAAEGSSADRAASTIGFENFAQVEQKYKGAKPTSKGINFEKTSAANEDGEGAQKRPPDIDGNGVEDVNEH